MNIALIVHFTTQTLGEHRVGGHVVSSSEMAGGKNYRIGPNNMGQQSWVER